MNINGFYHIGSMGRWQSIYENQVQLLKSSGLLDITENVYIGVSGPMPEIDLFPKAKIIVHNEKLEEGENQTLRKMYEMCQTIEPCKIWYIHTKGASRKTVDNTDSWRKYLEYFVITKHKNCIEALDEYDACGAEWRKHHDRSLFVGNFWWANSSYIKYLENILAGYLPTGSGERHHAEYNFISKNNPKVKNFFDSKINLYDERLDPSVYVDKKQSKSQKFL
jgi:hypothetical protein